MAKYLTKALSDSWGKGTMAYYDPLGFSGRDQTLSTAPSFIPFKFESRRARIDWRLLHGVDINAIVRDIDLDTLEKIVSIVAFGDIEAEDTRHLTELNFIKIFRLAQLMIEYLLYVQDCLQTTNNWLQQDRANMDKYLQAARLRVREVDTAFKVSKRELRRTRKTLKTFEAITTLTGGKGADGSLGPLHQQQQQQPQQELLLRKELSLLSDRLTRAQLETGQLRLERDELYQYIREIDAAMKANNRGTASQLQPKLSDNPNNKEMQDKLAKAFKDIQSLKREKDEVQGELDKVLADRLRLQSEKNQLLQELINRPTDAAASSGDATRQSLGNMLVDAEKVQRRLEVELAESQQAAAALQEEVSALQKQLMKAMKEAAKPRLGSSAGDEVQRALQAAEAVKLEQAQRISELEQELSERKRSHSKDIAALQDELELTQTQAAEAQRKLAELKLGMQQQAAAVQMAVRPKLGLVPVQQEAAGPPGKAADPAADASVKARIAEYEAMNECLSSQIVQLRDERSSLASDNQRLGLLLEQANSNRTVGLAGSQAIERDWKTEEIERLKQEVTELQASLQQRDAELNQLQKQLVSCEQQVDDEQTPRVSSPVKLQHPSDTGHNNSFKFGVASLRGSAQVESPRMPFTSASPARVQPAMHQLQQAASTPSASHHQSSLPAELQAPASLSSEEAIMLRRRILARVADQTPKQLAVLIQDELRVLSEFPYEYQDDDVDRFRALLPYELANKPGILSKLPHTAQDLGVAHQLHTSTLLADMSRQLAAFGLTPDVQALSDKEYAAMMLELDARRQARLAQMTPEKSDQAIFLRDAFLTHLELVKRVQEQAVHMHMPTTAPAAPAAATAAAAGAGAVAAASTSINNPHPAALASVCNGDAMPIYASSASSVNTALHGQLAAGLPMPSFPPNAAGPSVPNGMPQLQQQQQHSLPMHHSMPDDTAPESAYSHHHHHQQQQQQQVGARPMYRPNAATAAQPAHHNPTPFAELPPPQYQQRPQSQQLPAGAEQAAQAASAISPSATHGSSSRAPDRPSPGPLQILPRFASGHAADGDSPFAAAQPALQSPVDSNTGSPLNQSPTKSGATGAKISGVSALNASIRSVGRPASLRDYSAADFDDEDEDDSVAVENISSDDLDGDVIDEGVDARRSTDGVSHGGSPTPKILARPAVDRVSPASAAPGSSSPSRLARATSAANTPDPKTNPHGTSGKWTEAMVATAQTAAAAAEQDVERESIQSFNATSASGQAALEPVRGVGGAWDSPSNSIQGRGNAAVTAAAGGSSSDRPSATANRWSEGLQPFRQTAISEIEAMSDDDSGFESSVRPSVVRAGRHAQFNTQGSSGIAAVAKAAAARQQLTTQDSLDAVSDVEYL